MKKTFIEPTKAATGVMKYEDALSHISVVLNGQNYTAMFKYECICSFSCDLDNVEIKGFNICYDKIFVKLDDKELLWPIQKYQQKVSLEEGYELLQSIKKENK